MAVTVRSNGNKQNLERVLNRTARKIVTRRAVGVLQSARANVPTRSGALKRSLGYAVTGTGYQNLEARVGSNLDYALHVEEGTRPHVIAPGRYMKFPGTNNFAGQIIFTKVVRHPGTAGKHFLRNALRKVIRST